LVNIINTKKIAVISSDNGLGHIKRSILLSNNLSKFFKNYKIIIYANKSKEKLLKNEIKLNEEVEFKNFSPDIEKLLRLKNPFNRILNSLPDLKKYHIVISDNLPEVLLKNKNTILFANFLWSEICSNQKITYKLKIENLLKKYEPIIFQNYLFGMKLSSHTHKMINKLNFFEFRLSKPKKIQNSILFTVGNTDDYSISIDKIILTLRKLPNKYKIFIEPRYFNDSLPYNFFSMNYSKKNISQMEYAIIRPGLGTIYSCLESNISMFILNSANKEIKYNREIIIKNKLGVRYDSNFLKIIKNFKKKDYNRNIDLKFFKKNELKKVINKHLKKFS